MELRLVQRYDLLELNFSLRNSANELGGERLLISRLYRDSEPVNDLV